MELTREGWRAPSRVQREEEPGRDLVPTSSSFLAAAQICEGHGRKAGRQNSHQPTFLTSVHGPMDVNRRLPKILVA